MPDKSIGALPFKSIIEPNDLFVVEGGALTYAVTASTLFGLFTSPPIIDSILGTAIVGTTSTLIVNGSNFAGTTLQIAGANVISTIVTGGTITIEADFPTAGNYTLVVTNTSGASASEIIVAVGINN